MLDKGGLCCSSAPLTLKGSIDGGLASSSGTCLGLRRTGRGWMESLRVVTHRLVAAYQTHPRTRACLERGRTTHEASDEGSPTSQLGEK